MTRKQAREEAFILIFEKQFNSDSLEDILECAVQVREIEPDSYIRSVFFGVYENLEELDGIISGNSVGWSIRRISKTALAVPSSVTLLIPSLTAFNVVSEISCSEITSGSLL